MTKQFTQFTIEKIDISTFEDFYENNPDFNVFTFNFDNKSEVNSLKWKGIDKETVIKEFKTYQRLLKIYPDLQVANLLLGRFQPSSMETPKTAFFSAGPPQSGPLQPLSPQPAPSHPAPSRPILDSAYKIVEHHHEGDFIAEYAPQLGENGRDVATQIYRNAATIHTQTTHQWAMSSQLSQPYTASTMTVNNISDSLRQYYESLPDYEQLFGSQNYCECAECKSIFGPAAYFVDLMRVIDRYITRPYQRATKIPPNMSLEKRRPDLSQIMLTCENTNQVMPYLTIVNERLEDTVNKELNHPEDLYLTLAQKAYPVGLPFQLPLQRIRIYLKQLQVTLTDIYSALDGAPLPTNHQVMAAEKLGLSAEEWEIIAKPTVQHDQLRNYYGLSNLNTLADPATFCKQMDIKIVQLKELLYQNLSPEEVKAGLSKQFSINHGLAQPIAMQIVNNKEQIGHLVDVPAALDQVHRFLRLAKKLEWSYQQLDWALHCAGKGNPAITENTLVELAKLYELEKTSNHSIPTICSMLFDLQTYGKSDEPPFDQVFNGSGITGYHPKDAKTVSYRLNPSFTDPLLNWAIGSQDDANRAITVRIAAGLGVQEHDLNALGNYLFDGSKTVSLDVNNLSLLYRHKTFASVLRLPIIHYVKVFTLLQTPKKIDLSPDDVSTMIDKAACLRRSRLNVFELDYIINGIVSPYVELPYRPQILDHWLKSVPTQIQSSSNNEETRKKELINQLAALFSAPVEQIDRLLAFIGDPDVMSIFVDQPNRNKSPEIIRNLSRALVLTLKLRLTNEELSSIYSHPSAYGLTGFSSLNADQVLTMYRMKELCNTYGDVDRYFLDYVDASDEEKMAEAVAALTNQTTESVTQALNIYKDANKISRFEKISHVLTIVKKTGTNIDFLQQLKKLGGASAKEHWNTYQTVADNLLTSVRARLAPDQWDDLYLKLDGQVQNKKRTALVATAIDALSKQEGTKWIHTARHLYEYLLIDVDMSGYSTISYIKEALNATQLYLIRCREGLEPGIEKLEIPNVWWEWLMNYRIWEGNRKIFLYPENYLNPAYRSSKTKLFKNLENILNQGDINQENVENAFKKYLDQFSELAKLKYVDSYYCNITDKTRKDALTLFLIARTETQPYKYYYIIRESTGAWSEWNEISISINAATVSPVYAFDRLFLFWVEQNQHNNNSSDKKDSKANIATIHYTFYDFNKTWVQPQTLVSDVTIFVENSQFQATHQKIFPGSLFDVDQLCWNKVYPLKIEKDGYWIPGTGANKTEKIVLFFGPMIDIDPYEVISDLKKPTSSDADMCDFEERLYHTIQNLNQTKDFLYSGYCPIFSPIVINDDLSQGFLSNPHEALILRKESAKSNKFIRTEIDRSAGRLNLVQSEEIIEDNYLANEAHTPTLSTSANAKNTQLSSGMRHTDYKVSTIKNHPAAFMFNGDKESFLLMDINKAIPSISRCTVNSDLLFTPTSFVSSAVEMNSQGSVTIYKLLINLGYFDDNGRLLEFSDIQDLRTELSKQITSSASEKITSSDWIDFILNTLTNSPIFSNDSFITDTSININKEGSKAIYDQLISAGYLDKSGRLQFDTDFDDLINELNSILAGQPNRDMMVRYVVDTLYQKTYPTSLGFFDPISVGDRRNDTFAAIRLTTAAVHRLSSILFTKGIDGLLSLASQQIPVESDSPFDRFQFSSSVTPPDALDGNQVDFSGAYGLYYWELFFHVPLHIANLLKAHQQFQEAEKWYHYIFNPTVPKQVIESNALITSSLRNRDAVRIYKVLQDQNIITKDKQVSPTFNHQTDLAKHLTFINAKQIASVKNVLLNYQLSTEMARFWQFQPFRNYKFESLKDQLTNPREITSYNQNPFDPHAIASLRIGAYEKAVVMEYVDNLLLWGDSYFSLYTWENIVAATNLYVHAYNLLGERPQNLGKFEAFSPKNFQNIRDHYQADIPQFFIDLEQNAVPSGIEMEFSPVNFIPSAYFCVPENSQFIGYWDRVEDRLYKIRHCLNIQGVAQDLALFEPSIDPNQLILAAGKGGDVLSAAKTGQVNIIYRFSHLLERAKYLASVVSSLGSQLLAALEKQDAEALALLLSTQESTILNLTTLMKQKQIEETNYLLDSLKENRQRTQEQYDYYKALYDENMSSLEKDDLIIRGAAIAPQTLANAARGISIAAYLQPNIFGFSNGGMQFGDAVNAGAQIHEGIASIMDQSAALVSTKAQYARRRQEWELQRKIATSELNEIDQQILANESRVALLERELAIHQKTMEQREDYHDFLKNKFTNQDLYQWMLGRLSTIYFQTYRLALETATAAQSAYQNELSLTTQFVQFDAWDSMHRGLMAGEALTLTLNQMEKAYLESNSRTLEVEKTISLLHLDPIKFLQFREGLNGKDKGTLTFELSEQLFDFDFPGHYCRKIKSVAVTIPAIVGPYQNINATLVQTNHSIVVKPELGAVQYLIDKTGTPPDGSLLNNYMPNQYIGKVTLTRGMDDSGLFVVDFNDARYLPFEGTGAVSSWTLSLPPETNRFDFSSIADIIVKVRYTAKEGGSQFISQVKEKLSSSQPPYPYTPAKVYDLKQAFSLDWHNLMNRPPQEGVQQIVFPLTDQVIFPNLNAVLLKSAEILLMTQNGVVVTDKDIASPFMSVQFGTHPAKAIPIGENNVAKVDLSTITDPGKECRLAFTVNNAPEILLKNKALNPDVLTGVVVVITYQTNVFSRP